MSSLRRTVLVVQPDRLPWEKERGESAKAFYAFSIYRDFGAARSLARVGRTLGETGVAGPSMVEGWSVRWRWVERADAFDREEDKVARAEHRRMVSEARRTEAMAGTLMLGAAIRRLAGDTDSQKNEAAVIEALDLNKTTAGDVARLADTGAKLLDKGLGIAPDFHGVTTVSGAAVYDLARALLVLATEELDKGMRAAVTANGDLGSLVAEHQNRLVEEASRLYTRTRVRGSAAPARAQPGHVTIDAPADT
jgi:hypothetical protein